MRETDNSTIFGLKSDEKVFLGKEKTKKLGIETRIEKVWSDVYVVCNGVVGDYQRLISMARVIAKKDETELGVDVKRIVSALSNEVNKISHEYLYRPFDANLIFGSPGELIYLDATREGFGAVFEGENIYACGDKAKEVYGFFKGKDIKDKEDFKDLKRILDDYDVMEI